MLYFRAGETVYFEGFATDAEDGPLPPSALNWTVVWHHDEHTHPGIGPLQGIESGQWLVPTTGETAPNVWYRIQLEAIDNNGLSQQTYVDIFPEYSNIILEGKAGLTINADGQLLSLPDTIISLIGLRRNILAPIQQTLNDTSYLFSHWNGNYLNNLQTFNTPEEETKLIAHYDTFPLGQVPAY